MLHILLMKSLKGLKLLLFIISLLATPLAAMGNEGPKSCRLIFSESGSTKIDNYAYNNLMESLRVLTEAHAELNLKLQEPSIGPKAKQEYETQIHSIEASIQSLSLVTQSLRPQKTNEIKKEDKDNYSLTHEELDALLKND